MEVDLLDSIVTVYLGGALLSGRSFGSASAPKWLSRLDAYCNF